MAYKYDPPDRFGAKDALPPGSADKKIVGAEIDEEFLKIQDSLINRQLAHAKYSDNRGGTLYSVNIDRIEKNGGNYKVFFVNKLDNDDYSIFIQAAAINAMPVIAYVTSQALLKPGGEVGNPDDYEATGFEFQIRDWNGSAWVMEQNQGFTFTVIDDTPLV